MNLIDSFMSNRKPSQEGVWLHSGKLVQLRQAVFLPQVNFPLLSLSPVSGLHVPLCFWPSWGQEARRVCTRLGELLQHLQLLLGESR